VLTSPTTVCLVGARRLAPGQRVGQSTLAGARLVTTFDDTMAKASPL
jgi:hypothetical protein